MAATHNETRYDESQGWQQPQDFSQEGHNPLPTIGAHPSNNDMGLPMPTQGDVDMDEGNGENVDYHMPDDEDPHADAYGDNEYNNSNHDSGGDSGDEGAFDEDGGSDFGDNHDVVLINDEMDEEEGATAMEVVADEGPAQEEEWLPASTSDNVVVFPPPPIPTEEDNEQYVVKKDFVKYAPFSCDVDIDPGIVVPFVEPTYSKYPVPLDVDVCMLCGGAGAEEHMIWCHDCGECYHAYCLSPAVLKSDILPSTLEWRCTNCKFCDVCHESHSEEQLIVCDKCDRCFHSFCLQPQLEALPEEGWRCNTCVECLKCHAKVPSETDPAAKWTYSYTLCVPCGDIYKERLEELRASLQQRPDLPPPPLVHVKAPKFKAKHSKGSFTKTKPDRSVSMDVTPDAARGPLPPRAANVAARAAMDAVLSHNDQELEQYAAITEHSHPRKKMTAKPKATADIYNLAQDVYDTLDFSYELQNAPKDVDINKQLGHYNFRDAAYLILKKANRPLSIVNITHIALSFGLIATLGKTPDRTMGSNIHAEMLRQGPRSRFTKVATGIVDLSDFGFQLAKTYPDGLPPAHIMKMGFEMDAPADGEEGSVPQAITGATEYGADSVSTVADVARSSPMSEHATNESSIVITEYNMDVDEPVVDQRHPVDGSPIAKPEAAPDAKAPPTLAELATFFAPVNETAAPTEVHQASLPSPPSAEADHEQPKSKEAIIKPAKQPSPPATAVPHAVESSSEQDVPQQPLFTESTTPPTTGLYTEESLDIAMATGTDNEGQVSSIAFSLDDSVDASMAATPTKNASGDDGDDAAKSKRKRGRPPKFSRVIPTAIGATDAAPVDGSNVIHTDSGVSVILPPDWTMEMPARLLQALKKTMDGVELPDSLTSGSSHKKRARPPPNKKTKITETVSEPHTSLPTIPASESSDAAADDGAEVLQQSLVLGDEPQPLEKSQPSPETQTEQESTQPLDIEPTASPTAEASPDTTPATTTAAAAITSADEMNQIMQLFHLEPARGRPRKDGLPLFQRGPLEALAKATNCTPTVFIRRFQQAAEQLGIVHNIPRPTKEKSQVRGRPKGSTGSSEKKKVEVPLEPRTLPNRPRGRTKLFFDDEMQAMEAAPRPISQRKPKHYSSSGSFSGSAASGPNDEYVPDNTKSKPKTGKVYALPAINYLLAPAAQLETLDALQNGPVVLDILDDSFNAKEYDLHPLDIISKRVIAAELLTNETRVVSCANIDELEGEPLAHWDARPCSLCKLHGDRLVTGRLLFVDLDQWVHYNCALFSSEVYETELGELMNVAKAIDRGKALKCSHCGGSGATILCRAPVKCLNNYHFQCAIKANCKITASDTDHFLVCPFHARGNLGPAPKKSSKYIPKKQRVPKIEAPPAATYIGENPSSTEIKQTGAVEAAVPDVVPTTDEADDAMDIVIKEEDCTVAPAPEATNGRGDVDMTTYHASEQAQPEEQPSQPLDRPSTHLGANIGPSVSDDDLHGSKMDIDTTTPEKPLLSLPSGSEGDTFVETLEQDQGLAQPSLSNGVTEPLNKEGASTLSCEDTKAPSSNKRHFETPLKNFLVVRRLFSDRTGRRHRQTKGSVPSRRLGALTVQAPGIIVWQNPMFHTTDQIFPMGYHASRLFWSMDPRAYASDRADKHIFPRRCLYDINIASSAEYMRPLYRIVCSDCPNTPIQAWTPADAWRQVVDRVNLVRRPTEDVLMTGSDITNGLSQPSIVKLFESLIGARMLRNYSFKYDLVLKLPVKILRAVLWTGQPDVSLALPENPSGCARTEPYRKISHNEKFQYLDAFGFHPSTLICARVKYARIDRRELNVVAVLYRNMQLRSKGILKVMRSAIQGWGVFPLEDIKADELIIEYVGELIRQPVADAREKRYDARGIGCYMFRLDENWILDATVRGNIARFINHSCDPNAATKTIEVNGVKKIVVYAKRDIPRGTEIAYDYMFAPEEVKIPCHCGAVTCRGWMN